MAVTNTTAVGTVCLCQLYIWEGVLAVESQRKIPMKEGDFGWPRVCVCGRTTCSKWVVGYLTWGLWVMGCDSSGGVMSGRPIVTRLELAFRPISSPKRLVCVPIEGRQIDCGGTRSDVLDCHRTCNLNRLCYAAQSWAITLGIAMKHKEKPKAKSKS